MISPRKFERELILIHFLLVLFNLTYFQEAKDLICCMQPIIYDACLL